MGIRIQPLEIEVPLDNPFQYDQLAREESVEILTHLVSSIEGPCVLAIDAAWGTGKTTFLRIWTQHLSNKGATVIQFNAWETDFSNDPFVALSAELTDSLRNHQRGKLLARKLRKAAKEVLSQAVPSAIKHATAGMINIDSLLEDDDRLSNYQKAKKSIREFRKTLQDTAEELVKANRNHSLFVVIDELDRCRPSYAIELLETAKHLFMVNHIVFVLTVDRYQLAHSIKVLYGKDFDASGYLRRFFDIDFRLPDPERGIFIKARLRDIKLSDYFDSTKDKNARPTLETVENMLLIFFGLPKLSLRNVSQALHRLGLVFASLRKDRKSFAIAAVVALIFRTIDPDLYKKFIQGGISDQKVIDSVFEQLGANNLLGKDERIIFEGVIILGNQEKTISNMGLNDRIDSPLLQSYQKFLEGIEKPENMPDNLLRSHAQYVVDYVNINRRAHKTLQEGFGWQHSIKRLELISPSLVGENTLQDKHVS